MKRVLRAASYLLLASLCLAATGSAITATTVLERVNKVGPRETIKSFIDKPAWETILKGIGSADEHWLEVYSRLKEGADGASGEDLDTAIWDVALPTKPFKVFPLIGDASCTFTFEAQCPPGGIKAYLDHLEQSVKKAKTPEEQRLRDSCLEGISKTRAAFPNPRQYCAQ